MHLGRLLRTLPLALFLALASSCANDLTEDFSGKFCNRSHACSSGYRCDEATLICVPEASAADASAANASTAGASAADGCEDGSVDCDGQCVRLASDPKNCGGCGATCSAPPHGVPICLNGTCNFACPDSAACGDVCVDFQNDPENCGACE